MSVKAISNDKSSCFPGTLPAKSPVGKAAMLIFLALFFPAVPAAVYPAVAEDTQNDEMQDYSDDFARSEQVSLELEKGKLYFEDESYDLARRHLLAVLRLDREHLEARYYLGLLESRCKEHKLAIEYFTAIYKKEPQYRELSFEMAFSHLELGQCNEARNWIDRYLKKNPKSKKALKLSRKIKDCLKKQEKRGG